MTETFIDIMDLIGTVAFAISGSMVAVEQQMDIFGIMILALTTATGGGFIRDLTIGNIPPAAPGSRTPRSAPAACGESLSP